MVISSKVVFEFVCRAAGMNFRERSAEEITQRILQLVQTVFRRLIYNDKKEFCAVISPKKSRFWWAKTGRRRGFHPALLAQMI